MNVSVCRGRGKRVEMFFDKARVGVAGDYGRVGEAGPGGPPTSVNGAATSR